MKVAVFGCLHGMLNEMYDEVERAERPDSKIDFIIVCGDCQTLRHPHDLECLCVPEVYKRLGDFHEYYSGKKKVPKLTIFVGGNHEASNYLMTLPYGGWVCHNFYYLGYAGVIKYKGLRIAGVSGIFNSYNCNRGRFERLPLDQESKKSIYHTRRLDVFRLQLLSERADTKDPIDVFLSHDWPARIYEYGNLEGLLKYKQHLRRDVESSRGLGSPQTEPLVRQLKPKRWFAAHLHCRFYAKVVHDQSTNRLTEFLSLNKIDRHGRYMEILDLNSNRQFDETDDDLYYDEEWLTILRKTVNLEVNSKNNVFCPSIDSADGKACVPTDDEIQETVRMMNESGGLKIKKNFKMTEPVIYNRPNGLPPSMDRERRLTYPNYQHEELVARLQLGRSNVKESKNVKTESNVKQEQATSVKEESADIKPKLETGLKPKVESDVKPKVEAEVESDTDGRPPNKRRAYEIELDEGCLPIYIETKGEK